MHYNVWVVRAAFDGCKYLRVHPACMYYNVCFIRAVLTGVVYIHRLLSGMGGSKYMRENRFSVSGLSTGLEVSF